MSERTALGISEQEFQSKINSKIVAKSNIVVPQNYTITPKKFRINFFSYKNNDNSNNTVTTYYEMAALYVKRLNKLYKPYQICFELNLREKFTGDDDEYGPKDAINVWIYKALGSGAHGSASYHDNNIYVKESAMWHEEALLAHEIGHAFYLRHTHGNFNRPSPGFCDGFTQHGDSCEHVTRDPNDPNYNATTEGDLVYDTAADPGLFTGNSVDHPNCLNVDALGNYIGQQVDCQNTYYDIDNSVLKNIMAYNKDAHRILFTTGQAERIHYLLDTANNNLELKKALILPADISNVDLMLRNSESDSGFEPDTVSTMFWQSPDIWIRKVNDTERWHENPEYGIGDNYAKVRIVNKGCDKFEGGGKLKLYWAKAGTSLPKDVWKGGIYSANGYPLGDLIGEADLPALESYEDYVFTFPWAVPNPADYSDINEPWHFCLLAKIESPNDVSSLPEDNGVYYHFLNSNNIALHNVSVINNTSSNSGKIHIGNFTGTVKKFKIKLSKDILYNSNTNIFNEAEIKFTFDNKLWSIWQNGGFQGTNFSEFGDKTIIVNEDTEIFLNDFPAKDFGLLNVKVNFLTNAYTSNDQFGFNLEHWDNDTNELMGGELYFVNKNQRDLFVANASVMNNTLQAVSINEPAVYNWYDANGNLLHTGQNYTASNTNGTYLLEVIADYDGYKDMKQVNVNSSNTLLLHNIYPNPATNNVTIQYNQLNYNNAYLMLVNVNTNTTANYILNLNNTSININIGQYIPGLYRVVLVCDNNAIESHNLIIQ